MDHTRPVSPERATVGRRLAAYGTLLVGLFVALSACGGKHPRASPDNLSERVTQYWTFRQHKDLAAMYPFYSGEYRQRVSRSEFLKLGRLVRFDLLSFRIVRIDRQRDTAQVTIAYRSRIPTLPVPDVASQITEAWIRAGSGEWFKKDEPLVLPFPKVPSYQAVFR